MPFQPKGDTAQWRIVYDLLKSTPLDTTVTYEQLADALAKHPARDRHRIQAAVRRAADTLLAQDDRALEVEPQIGYRLVNAARQITLATQQADRAGNALAKGRDLTVHVRMDELNEGDRRVVQAMALGFQQVAEWARQVGQRVIDHEGRLTDIEAELQRMKADRELAASNTSEA